MKIITVDHPGWDDFCDRLEAALHGDAAPDDDEAFVRGCNSRNHEAPFATARAILAAMDDVDIEASLAYVQSKGGFCDCTILMNVDPCR